MKRPVSVKWLVVGLLVLAPTGLTAQRRNVATVLSLGAKYLATSEVSLRHWSGAHAFEHAVYIVADDASQRSIIVAADERMIPVLAELDHTPAEGTTLPPALQELLTQYAREYDALQSGTIEQINASQPLTAMPDVTPLMQTTWGQSSPYNDECPLNCPSGCVATAMAQIMYFHRYPEHGLGSHSYHTESRHITQSMDFSSTYFDWQNMLPTYGRSATSAQRNAVATLMHACGVSVNMDYDIGGSGARAVDVPYALINFFGYNPNTECLLRDYYSTSEWNQRLAAELKAGRPVIYCGHDPRDTAGHAFVIDGCRSSDSNVHVNWGWDGDYDGYYVLSSLNPSRYRFTTHQQMVAQFSPNVVGTHEDVAYADRFSVSGALEGGGIIQAVIKGLSVIAAMTSYSIQTARFNGYVGLGVWNSQMHFMGTLYEQDIVNWSMADEHDINIRCALQMSGLTDGTYYLAPYVRASDINVPTRIRTPNAQSDVVAFTVRGDNVTPNEPIPTPTPTGIIWEESFETGALPETIAESSIQGNGEWEVVQVLFSQSGVMPEAATGRGYAALRNRGLGLSGRRVVSRLVTDDITLPSGKQNKVSVNVRKHVTRPDSDDALTLYAYTTEGGWQLLKEVSVMNSSVWEAVTVDLPESMKRCRIAVEGSLGIGATLFVDDLCVYTTEATGINAVSTTAQGNKLNVNSIDGRTMVGGNLNTAARLAPGIYIINGTKVAVK